MASYDDTATVSGSVVGFSNGADSVPLKNWQVTLPASLDGYTSIAGTKSGKNVIQNLKYQATSNRVNIGQSDDGFSVSLRAGTYTLSVTSSINVRAYYRGSLDGSNTLISPTYSTSYSGTFTLSEDKDVRMWVIGQDGSVSTSDILTIQLEVGSTATAYEPYTAPTSYTANLGRTIYGGQADIVNGTGVDGARKDTMTSTYLNGLAEGYIGYTASVSAFGGHSAIWVRNFGYPYANQIVSGGIGCVCNHFPVTMNNQSVVSSQYRIYFDVDGKNISSASDFIDYVEALEANNDSLDIVYEVSSPTDFTFDPVTIETSKGSNTFWSDQGNTELTYYKDGYGFTSVTVHKETPEGEPVEETRKLHRIIYEGQVDVISGTGLIYRGESGTQYDPPEQISFTPIEVSTDEGENTLYADQGDSAITYRKAVD